MNALAWFAVFVAFYSCYRIGYERHRVKTLRAIEGWLDEVKALEASQPREFDKQFDAVKSAFYRLEGSR